MENISVAGPKRPKAPLRQGKHARILTMAYCSRDETVYNRHHEYIQMIPAYIITTAIAYASQHMTHASCPSSALPERATIAHKPTTNQPKPAWNASYPIHSFPGIRVGHRLRSSAIKFAAPANHRPSILLPVVRSSVCLPGMFQIAKFFILLRCERLLDNISQWLLTCLISPADPAEIKLGQA